MTTTQTNYTIVTANSAEALIGMLDEKVSEGWQLLGGPSIPDTSHCEVEVEPIFAQALTRRSE
jgi:Domain of unknown function (DUF1737)